MFFLPQKNPEFKESFQKTFGIPYVPGLQFLDTSVKEKVKKRIKKFHERGELSEQQLWYGSYYQKEILNQTVPQVSIRKIDDQIGWGVFAEQDFKKFDFIAEYAGCVRKYRRSDRKNDYCFEYLYASGTPSPFTIDAQMQGGIIRFVNHSTLNPNLDCTLATIDDINHVILLVKKPIAKGEQLTYDYGPNYWSKREKPIEL